MPSRFLCRRFWLVPLSSHSYTRTTMKPLAFRTGVAALLAGSGTATQGATSASLSCGPAEDWVATLPGLPTEQPLVPIYSGYLHYELSGQTVHTHYTLIGAELDPLDSKPLIYWSSTLSEKSCGSRWSTADAVLLCIDDNSVLTLVVHPCSQLPKIT